MPRTDPAPDAGSASGPGPAAATPLLRQILDEARAAGFLGPGPLDIQLRHSEGFVVVARRLWPDGATPPVLLDLGSGGGLPGLVLAVRWPEVSLLLLDAHGRRTAFLSDAVRRLGLEHRVSVRQDRAEVAGRDPGLRGTFDGVLARSFGRPAVVAECAAPLLRPGGWLIVSEPPAVSPADPDAAGDAAPPTAAPPTAARNGSEDTADRSRDGDAPSAQGHPRDPARWPPEPLRQLGLEPERLVHEEFDYQTVRQIEVCPDRFPRRDGVPAKRPLSDPGPLTGFSGQEPTPPPDSRMGAERGQHARGPRTPSGPDRPRWRPPGRCWGLVPACFTWNPRLHSPTLSGVRFHVKQRLKS